MMKKKIILFCLVAVILFGFASSVFALEWPNSPIGTAFNPSDPKTDLRVAIKYFYEWAIVLGGLAAFVMLLYAGFQYLTSTGDPTKTKDARDRIGSAVGGLVLLLASFILLNIVNPELTTLRTPQFSLGTEDLPLQELLDDLPEESCKEVLVYSDANKQGGLLETVLPGRTEEFLPNKIGTTTNEGSLEIRGGCTVLLFPSRDTSRGDAWPVLGKIIPNLNVLRNEGFAAISVRDTGTPTRIAGKPPTAAATEPGIYLCHEKGNLSACDQSPIPKLEWILIPAAPGTAVENLADQGFKDKAKSLGIVKSLVDVVVFENSQFKRSVICFTESEKDLEKYKIPNEYLSGIAPKISWEANIESLKILKDKGCVVPRITFQNETSFSRSNQKGVVFYDKNNFTATDGKEIAVFRKHIPDLSNVGNLGLAESARGKNGWNDAASSIHVTANVDVLLYERAKYQGQVMCLQSGKRINLESDPLLSRKNWGDRISSIELLQKGTCRDSGATFKDRAQLREAFRSMPQDPPSTDTPTVPSFSIDQ